MAVVGALAAWILAPALGLAAVFQPLQQNEAAAWGGATHVAIITHEDLTETTDSTAQTLTNVVQMLTNQIVELVAARVVTPFSDSANTTNNPTTTVTVGDGTDTDLYLTSMEVNSYTNMVYLKLGRGAWQVQAAGTLVTNVTIQTTLDDNGTNYMTNIVLQTQAIVHAAKLYTSRDSVDFVFTPTTGYDLEDLTAGEIRFYFRIYTR